MLEDGSVWTGHPVHVNAYIPYVHTFYTYIPRAQAIPACSMHMHAPQNKASSLGGALQRLHSLLSPVYILLAAWVRRRLGLASLCPFLATPRTNSYSNTLWLCSWFAKERVIASPVSPANVREIPLANRGIAYRAVRSIV